MYIIHPQFHLSLLGSLATLRTYRHLAARVGTSKRRRKAMANYPQELAQDAVCPIHTGHVTGLWFLPARPLRLNTNEWIYTVAKSLLPANYFVPIYRLWPLEKSNINHSCAVIISNYIYQQMHIQYARHHQLIGHIKLSYTFRQGDDGTKEFLHTWS